MTSRDQHAVLVQLRAYLAQREHAPNARLPAERPLADLIGITRGELRKALAVLEGEGLIWRRVGKGTFLAAGEPYEVIYPGEIAAKSTLSDAMRARLTLEPAIVAEAALNARRADISAMRDCLAASREARTWREYESCDNRFHKLIAESTHNPITSATYDILAGVRRTVVWSRPRVASDRPPPDHHSFAEHGVIVDAVAARDPAGSSAAMFAHLRTVERLLTDREIPGSAAPGTAGVPANESDERMIE